MLKGRWLRPTILCRRAGLGRDVAQPCSSTPNTRTSGRKINILFIPWSQSSNAFFEAVVNGAKDAAAQQGVNVDIQFGEEDANKQKTIFETGIANRSAGLR